MALPSEAKKEIVAVVGKENFTDSKTKCEAYSRGGYGKFSWDRNRKIPRLRRASFKYRRSSGNS